MITSVSNPKVKRLLHLRKQAKARREAGLFLVEGEKMCKEAPKDLVAEVYISESHVGAGEVAGWGRIPVEILSDSVFRTVSDTQTPQGVLALVRQRERTLKEILSGRQIPLLLILEKLQDPGNLGTVLRTGEGAGVTGVVMSGDTVDIYNPKVVRATMGSIYRVPFCTVPDLAEAIGDLSARGIVCYAAAPTESLDYTEADYRGPTAFLIGNEGNGLSREAILAAGKRVRIPMAGEVESLNASMAAGLLMYEAARQRRKPG
ncbi:MAG: RNA methyltransferase [Lachnospiraceae bacterium]|nr:RNA methyltransferase [Lachnospiraceae bacterium]